MSDDKTTKRIQLNEGYQPSEIKKGYQPKPLGIQPTEMVRPGASPVAQPKKPDGGGKP